MTKLPTACDFLFGLAILTVAELTALCWSCPTIFIVAHGAQEQSAILSRKICCARSKPRARPRWKFGRFPAGWRKRPPEKLGFGPFPWEHGSADWWRATIIGFIPLC